MDGPLSGLETESGGLSGVSPVVPAGEASKADEVPTSSTAEGCEFPPAPPRFEAVEGRVDDPSARQPGSERGFFIRHCREECSGTGLIFPESIAKGSSGKIP